jgi:glycosyltransferase involved in cell wall biosynthesis
MIIGIDGSRAFLKKRTGIEEYSYQVIKNLRDKLNIAQVVLYLRKGQKIDFKLPENWIIKVIKWPRFWTQFGLSLEMIFYPVDNLFVPAHTVPLIHPRNTFVVIHGLEYEIIKKAYTFWERLYMRFSIKLSCRWAKKIITVSQNTKKDLINLYNIPSEKIEIIYEGVSGKKSAENDGKYRHYKPYLLFIGRLGKRKNIEGIISAFEILKEKYDIPHKLILVGKPGFGYEDIKSKIENSSYINEIIKTDFVSNDEKWELIRNAEVFLFPTFYEGFGLPILEAQLMGIPVVTSNVSSMPEVGGDSVAYSTPEEPISIADSTYKILNDENFRNDIIKKGNENVKKFSWRKCVEEISKIILN